MLKDAQKLKGTKVHYDLLTNNCEHMVTNLRYGEPESRQAQMAVSCVVVSLLVVLSAVVQHIVHRRKKLTDVDPQVSEEREADE
uniref:LRAT domain-containing protein n=1 Tax=Anguilla anguilla TaxID=7936 RepID=A0A0E9WJF2_ANGAN